MLAPCKKQRYLGRREREKYLGRREKGVKKFREKGDGNLGDMGPLILDSHFGPQNKKCNFKKMMRRMSKFSRNNA